METFSSHEAVFFCVAGNIAGFLETSGKIEIFDDNEFADTVIKIYEEYQADNSTFVWCDLVERRLLEIYGCEEETKHDVS